MVRTRLHRREQSGEVVAIGTGVWYIKHAGAWREMTKAELEVFETQRNITDNAPLPMTINAMLPDPASGTDDDCIVLLYPVGWDGPVWDPSIPNPTPNS